MNNNHTHIPHSHNQIFLLRSGDLRQNRNKTTWPAQKRMEAALANAFKENGFVQEDVVPYNAELEHGFIYNQRMGMDVFQRIPLNAKLVVAIAAWQYSHHILAGLRDHHGPILTVANWSGEWPGLVGLLNLNACLTKINKPYSSIWSEDFKDEFFKQGVKLWLETGQITHDSSHVREVIQEEISDSDKSLGEDLTIALKKNKAIIGVFDEGCMGMYNAIIDDELLNQIGIYKERLSQSALLAEMNNVSENEARAIRIWLDDRGMKFNTGPNHETDLTDTQILKQCKMYIAALRIAEDFQCDAIGIQYQQGLKDMAPASDLAEGLLNNPDRPPVYHRLTKKELYPALALPHFNEVDEGAAVDLLVNNRVWTALGLDPSSTIHDIRWGEHYQGNAIDDFVWVFMISGAVPASHLIDGYAGAVSERQPFAGFPSGGGTLKGISKPGEIVWSRIYINDNILQADLGRGRVVELPIQETLRRWKETTPVWPIMHAVLNGVNRNQMMARHCSNHVTVTYAPDANLADQALKVKSAMLAKLGIKVHWCGI
jgi:hypothetical protein